MLQLVAAAESNIGNALIDLGRPPAEAIRHFETAKTIFERLKMPRKVAEVQEIINSLLRYVFSRAREIKERRGR